jgi:hypothetical protein
MSSVGRQITTAQGRTYTDDRPVVRPDPRAGISPPRPSPASSQHVETSARQASDQVLVNEPRLTDDEIGAVTEHQGISPQKNAGPTNGKNRGVMR